MHDKELHLRSGPIHLLRPMIADSVPEANDRTCDTYFDKIPFLPGGREVENGEYA
jgi:hypothetical protein